LKSKEPVIWTYFITNEDFRDLILMHDDKGKHVLEKWIGANAACKEEINKAREFIPRIVFLKEQLQPHELDEMLERILT
jgi:hypothetical protein